MSSKSRCLQLIQKSSRLDANNRAFMKEGLHLMLFAWNACATDLRTKLSIKVETKEAFSGQYGRAAALSLQSRRACISAEVKASAG